MTRHDAKLSCYCHFCGSPLRFQIARVGEAVNCFNCSMETVLFIPGLAAPYPEQDYRLEAKDIVWGNGKFGGRHLTGTVLNLSTKNLDWVRVEFILYNKLGLPVGTTSDSLISFGSQRIWTFQAPVVQSEVVRASEPLLSCEYGRVNGTGVVGASKG
jgi:hypothetical protein